MGTAGTDRGCPPGSFDPPVVKDPPIVQVVTRTPAAAGAQLDPASVRVSAVRKRLTAAVTCPVQTAARCTGVLMGRTATKPALALGRRAFSIAQGGSRTVSLRPPCPRAGPSPA